MPQFDQSSFLNQVFWFLLFFISFYFFISYFFLPVLCKNIKFRTKKINQNFKDSSNISFEKMNKKVQLNFFFNLFFSKFEVYFNKIKSNNNNNLSLMQKKLLLNNNLNSNLLLFISKINVLSNNVKNV